MRSEQLLRFVFVNGLAVALGATVAISCIKVNYPTVAFRCNPKQGDNCPETHFCCSDDPSTADGGLPAYFNPAMATAGSPPMYADAQNAVGRSGMCVRTDDIPTGFGLFSPAALNCPIPCNPTWDASDVRAVCGADSAETRRVCCQTVELEDKDCVMDGETGLWRPVNGNDIVDDGEVPPTDWGNATHATHQDPGGRACGPGTADFLDCVRNLTVADQRGFCMSLKRGTPGVSADQVCPTDPRPVAEGGAGYLSVCDRKNMMAPPPV
jgi:hypothetical protein